MKTSQIGKTRCLLAASAIALAAYVAVPAVQADTTTTTTTPAYQPWSGATGQQLKSLIADLKAKIAAAEQSQAASPDFLADLKALVTKYEALQISGQGQGTPSGMAPGTQVFTDTFADGNYTANPAWKVSAGTWTVDPNGNNRGLNSKVRPQKLNINNVLGALLNSQSGSTSEQNQFASIYTPVKIPNAFALKVTFTSKDKQGALNLGVYQGSSGSTMYRVVYQPGAAPGIAIQKVTSQGATTLGSYNSTVNLEDGSPHTLVFSRDAKGNMKATLDEQSVATAKDTSLTGDMTGLLFINSGGAYYMREVTVVSN
ncbi:hypothetical protein [Dongia sedimenti]|uniref:Uncharacterized protein n=1 Tax=Dongia sedimenti TaxID=3064282 RepID=A0ABU0YLA0_9PROT|nr:hypothetical protein [Rhodospirillaceae bacterium R-7]